MNRNRFEAITGRYTALRMAVIGDFCLDRYLEIDPGRAEISIETGLPVHTVTRVRSQPGGAGTILNNLAALGVSELWPVGFCGDDGEGYELRCALAARPGVRLDHFIQTPVRRTFTYCKPLVMHADRPPEELSRLDSKNDSPTPDAVQTRILSSLRALAGKVDAIILLDQVEFPETGVVTSRLLEGVGELLRQDPTLLIFGDSRRGLRHWPPVAFKMNAAELATLTGTASAAALEQIQKIAATLAQDQGHAVFVTLAERGIVGATARGEAEHSPALPARGPIDIVGAGDAVTANLACALAAGATLHEAILLANAAASVVIHQLGTTGTASVPQLHQAICA